MLRMSTERSKGFRFPVPSLVADRLRWDERRTEMAIGFYRNLDELLVKYGSHVVRSAAVVDDTVGATKDRYREFALLESPEVDYQRLVENYGIIRDGIIWATQEVDRFETPRIVVRYEEANSHNPLRIVTVTKLGNVLGPDDIPYDGLEDFQKIQELVTNFGSRLGNVNKVVDPSTRPAESYPARVIKGNFGNSGYLKIIEEDRYEPL